MERNEFIRKIEETIALLQLQMKAALACHDEKILHGLFESFRRAQYEWLYAAQGMSQEKAHAVMIGFALGKLTEWMEGDGLGVPPSVLSLYDGPISDTEYGRLMEKQHEE